MITATAMIAMTTNSVPAAMSGLSKKVPIAFGTRLTMPAKMMKLIPLPMPFSVISSPNHMSTMAPAVRLTIWVMVSNRERSKPPVMTPREFSSARNPYAWRSAIGTVR